ncbi:hypothetical protein QRD89_07790 [Halobacillus sp. ACCC02827]|uniref:hypothetical protein n=1 Tax=Bacillaceae TaxID=186817 RepID=UPI0002A4D161|nr:MULTISPECIES: hypothetical protein [Bacillaceae]ELK45424.1 hypothetical protein D479_14927 [Halobacillus sp. BAB-2008]QHT46429.1 hypothetical protein M662_07965 [Bacillus sp. SB49]WJE17237.1 hypothetical protein QRD89_07790 [Halobacillus sp. ACCC02827]
MKNMKTMWMDEQKEVGVVELQDEVFGTSYHPVIFVDVEEREFKVINNLWYTTYHGARQFFRSKTNTYVVTGRMKKVRS